MSETIFNDVKYTISSSLPAERQAQLASILDANGASRATRLEDATHVVTDSINFEGKEKVKECTPIVTGEWVDRGILHGKQQDSTLFSADPNMIFSGVIACADDLEICDKEVIAAGINALGGLYREGYTRDCTHLLTPRPGSDKYNAAMHYKHITRVRVVLPHWFDDCFKHFTRLDETSYEWPDPPLLMGVKPTMGKAKLPARTREVVKADEVAEGMRARSAGADVDGWSKEDEDDSKMKKVNAGAAPLPPYGNMWSGRRILLSASLNLQPGRREAVEVSIQRSGGEIVKSSGNEEDDVDNADIYIIQHRKGRALLNALLKNKTIGTLSWLFNVHSTSVISRPEDQLLHYPTWTRPVEKFRGHKITATNYEGNARKYVKKLIEFMGGEFTPQMTSANTIVVAAFIGGQKTTKAREWNIPIVNHTWLEDCFVEWRHITPAQLRYVSFPENVNFGALVGQRSVRPMREEEIEGLRRECEMEERREGEEQEQEQEAEAMSMDMEASLARSKASQDVRTPSRHRTNRRLAPQEGASSPLEHVVNRQAKGKGEAEAGADADANADEVKLAEKGKSKNVSAKGKEPERHQLHDDVARLFEDEWNGGGPEILVLEEEEKEQPRRNEIFDGRASSKSKSGPNNSVPASATKGTATVNRRSTRPASRPVRFSSVKEEEGEEELDGAVSGDGSDGNSLRERKKTRVAEANTSPVKKRGRQPLTLYDLQSQNDAQSQRKGKDRDKNEDGEDDDSDTYTSPRRTVPTKKLEGRAGHTSEVKSSGRARTMGVEVEIVTPLRKNVVVTKAKTNRRAVVFQEDVSSAEEEEEWEEDAPSSDEASSRAHVKAKTTVNRGQTNKSRHVIHSAIASQTGSSKGVDADFGGAGEAASPNRAFMGQYSEASIRRSSLPSPIVVSAGSGAAEGVGAAGRRMPSRRQAAARASARLHEIAPDMLQFQKDLKRGTVRGPWETAQDKLLVREKETGNVGVRRKRRSSVHRDRSGVIAVEDDEVEDIIETSRVMKKAKLEKMSSVENLEEGRGKAKAATALGKKLRTSDVGRPKEEEDEAEEGEIRMLTTQVDLKPHVMKALQKLGVKMASKPSECNLLVAAAINRTEKFLCVMATVENIVNEKWVLNTVDAKRILPPEDYPLRDSQGEMKHKFRLADAIHRSRVSEKKLLSGRTFYFTKLAAQSEKFLTYRNVIISAGGTVAQNPSARILENQRYRHVISIPEDQASWKPLAKEGFAIYVPEFILAGVLTQMLHWSSRAYRLDGNVI